EIAGEQYRQRRDLVGAHAAEPLDAPALFGSLLRQRSDEPAPGKGYDAIGADAEPAHIERDRLGESDDAELRRRVIRLSEIADDARGRAEMHEAAALLLPEMGRRLAGDEIGAEEVYAHDALEILARHLVEDAVPENAGIVHDAVDAAKTVECGLDD